MEHGNQIAVLPSKFAKEQDGSLLSVPSTPSRLSPAPSLDRDADHRDIHVHVDKKLWIQQTCKMAPGHALHDEFLWTSQGWQLGTKVEKFNSSHNILQTEDNIYF